MDRGSWIEYVMKRTDITILSTREVNDELIREARSEGVQLDIDPFIRTEFIQSPLIDKEISEIKEKNTKVIFTSMTAVEAVTSKLTFAPPNWKIYCIGNTTSKLVKDYFGKPALLGTAASAAGLAHVVIKNREIQEVVFFCGDLRRDELPAILRSNGIIVKEITVYHTIPLYHNVSKDYDAILFFSPSAVNSFFNNNSAPKHTVLFAIGDTTAAQLKRFIMHNNRIIISPEGSKEELVKLSLAYLINERDKTKSWKAS